MRLIIFLLTVTLTHTVAFPALAENIHCRFDKECMPGKRCESVVYELGFMEHDEGGRYGLVNFSEGSTEGHTEFAFRASGAGTLLGVDHDSSLQPVRYYLLSFGTTSASMSVQGVDGGGEGWVVTYHGQCELP